MSEVLFKWLDWVITLQYHVDYSMKCQGQLEKQMICFFFAERKPSIPWKCQVPVQHKKGTVVTFPRP